MLVIHRRSFGGRWLRWSFDWLLFMTSFDLVWSLAMKFEPKNKAYDVGQSQTNNRLITNRMCPFAQKAWIALEVAKIPYQLEEVGLYGPNGKPDWFWKLNPKGTVPVLVCQDGNLIIPDSDAILDAIATGKIVAAASQQQQQSESFDNHPLGGDTPQHATKVKNLRQKVTQMLPIGKKVVQGGGGGGGASRSSLDRILRDMNDMVETPFICGDQITIADCAAFPFLWRLEQEFGFQGEEFTNLQTWLTTCRNHPAFAKTIPTGGWWWWW